MHKVPVLLYMCGGQGRASDFFQLGFVLEVTVAINYGGFSLETRSL